MEIFPARGSRMGTCLPVGGADVQKGACVPSHGKGYGLSNERPVPSEGNRFFPVCRLDTRAESTEPIILSIDLILKILQIEISSAILDAWTGGKGAYP